MNNLYDDYEEEDFILDESFGRYCRGTDPVAARFWNDWIARHPAKKELTEKAKKLYLLLSGDNNPGQFQRHEQLFREKFRQHLQHYKQEPVPLLTQSKPLSFKPALRRMLFVGIPLILILGTVILLSTKKNSVLNKHAQPAFTSHTSNGERKSFRLPDGTNVILNAASSITLSADFNQKVREIILDGEALLDVAHNADKPFVIHTASMDVRVLGTVLNIRAYSHDKKAETSLLKGKVEVTLKEDSLHKIILIPNQKIVVEQKPKPLKPTDNKALKQVQGNGYLIRQLGEVTGDSAVSEILWTKSRLVFDDESFEEIATVLERNYGVEINLSEEVKEFRYTGTFDSKKVEEIISALQLSKYFEYTISQDKKITIAKKIN